MAERTIHLDTNGDIWVVAEDQPSVMQQLFPERLVPKHYIAYLVSQHISTVLDQSRLDGMTPLVLIRASDVPSGVSVIPLDW
jgi:hypothetical protein